MRTKINFLLFLFLLIVPFAKAERGTLPPGTGVTVVRDASSTNIPTTYTTNAGISGLTALSGKSHILVYNGTGTDIAVCVSSTATNCVSGNDNLTVPAGQGMVLDNISINTHVCARSLGSAISSGKVYFVTW